MGKISKGAAAVATKVYECQDGASSYAKKYAAKTVRGAGFVLIGKPRRVVEWRRDPQPKFMMEDAARQEIRFALNLLDFAKRQRDIGNLGATTLEAKARDTLRDLLEEIPA